MIVLMRTVASSARRAALAGVTRSAAVHYSQDALARWSGIRGKILGPDQPGYADCLVAGTLVMLDRGEVPIEEVVVGDMALTRDGFRRVEAAWLARRDAEVFQIDLPNGRVLRGTGDHRVWTSRGWKRMQTLRAGDMLHGWESSEHPNVSSTPDTHSSATRTHRSGITAPTSSPGQLATFTASSGSKRTARFPTATRSITPTTIHSTTTWRTWSAFFARIIAASRRPPGFLSPSSAMGAVFATSPSLALVGNAVFARPPARSDGVASRASIWSMRSAPPVTERSRRIATDQGHGVPIAVMRLVAPVYKAGRSDVYDLTIQGSPEFFANGVLVHNCSAYVTWCVWQARVKHRGKAGVDVMNGANWSSGWTGTLLQHGKRHTSTRWWKPGRTLVFYGNPVDHVALYVGGGMVVSHGSESGPSYLHYSYRPDFNQARAYNV